MKIRIYVAQALHPFNTCPKFKAEIYRIPYTPGRNAYGSAETLAEAVVIAVAAWRRQRSPFRKAEV